MIIVISCTLYLTVENFNWQSSRTDLIYSAVVRLVYTCIIIMYATEPNYRTELFYYFMYIQKTYVGICFVIQHVGVLKYGV